MRAEGLSVSRIAHELSVPRTNLRRALARWATQDNGETPASPEPRTKADSVSVTVSGDTASVVMPAGMSLGDLDDLLRARGLDPEEWTVDRVTVNEWEALASGGGPDGEPRVVVLHQLKANLTNRRGAIGPAIEVAERYRPESDTGGRDSDSGRTARLVVVCGDQHAPYHDEGLHRAFLRWLADVQPDQGIVLGDLLDFPTISRHRDRLRWSASPKDCINAGFRILSDYRDACLYTAWDFVRGNHDWRLESELMQRAERMAFIGPAEIPGEDEQPHAYSLRNLLHLDKLGIGLVGVEGEDWRYDEADIGGGIMVTHEPPSQETASRLDGSFISGHSHRLGVRQTTAFRGGEPVVHSAVQAGCMCRTREGLGYTKKPNWQAGFVTASIRPDGSHHIDLATWRDGVLTWRGERWTDCRSAALQNADLPEAA